MLKIWLKVPHILEWSTVTKIQNLYIPMQRKPQKNTKECNKQGKVFPTAMSPKSCPHPIISLISFPTTLPFHHSVYLQRIL